MKTHKRSCLAWGTMLAGLVVGTTVPAGGQTTIFVDADAQGAGDGSSWADAFTAVQPALDAAQSGDQVWVAEGTYVENITLALGIALYGGFAGTEDPATFDLAGRDLSANPTVLDGNESGSVVTSPPDATASTRIDGFMIRNGYGTASGSLRYGGGIYCVDSSPSIANNGIADNYASGSGGGIFCKSSSPLITDNTIADNRAGHEGGGICCSQSSPTIANCTIANNRTVFHDGGGLSLQESSPTITDNVISSNYATGLGGGMSLRYSSPTISRNTIMANEGACGGGIWLDRSSPTVLHNRITGNAGRASSLLGGGGGLGLVNSSPLIANNLIAGNGSGLGGGLSLYLSSPTITNNTITANHGAAAGGLYLKDHCAPVVANNIIAFNSSGVYRPIDSPDVVPTFRSNCIYGNADFNFENLADPTGTGGNISVDALLASSAYGNTHLQPDSPCVDAGDNAYVNGDHDIDGQPRIQPAGGLVDIGADESDGTTWQEGPYAVVRVSPDGHDEHDGSSWTLAKRTVQAGLDAAAAVGGEVWVQAGTYYERIALPSFAYAYGGFAGTETQRDERDRIAHVTTLDAGQWGSVVEARSGYRVSTIDGFTITGGGDSIGGGVTIYHASPIIANNAIVGNYGGGLFQQGASSVITNNTITGNVGSEGGGIIAYGAGASVITGNTITGNHASGTGGGLTVDGSSPLIANNVIVGNGASMGGGLYLNSSSPTITNNTIASNCGATAGGLYLGDGSSPMIANTIIALNSSGVYRPVGAVGVAPTFRSNCVYGNAECDFENLTDPTGTNGNISVDPNLASPAHGNVHLQPGSPCVDAGNNAYVNADYDIDGQPRIQPAEGAVDIGADESDGTAWPEGPYAIVRVSADGDDEHDGSSWPLAKRTVQSALDAAAAIGGEVWVQAGTYYERITLPSFTFAYGGFAGAETQRDERNWKTNVTTLDGEARGSVVSAIAGYRVSRVDGFTITHGHASTKGGGVNAASAGPEIMNNIITDNRAEDDGGGLFVCSCLVAGNTITGNWANWHGGGARTCGRAIIANNVISRNSARFAGGVALVGSATVENNVIIGNRGRGGCGAVL
ncbi:MAG: right-handed parallel beta-helix repeat-containing protein, partial [Phycisphaerae bacterium]|nr:right-handed parallel beta-helix repeat-containing protein [Phycisphaerae bacterium]